MRTQDLWEPQSAQTGLGELDTYAKAQGHIAPHTGFEGRSIGHEKSS